MSEDKKISIKKIIPKLIFLILLLGTIFLGIYLVAKHFGITDITEDELHDLVKSTGIWAPLVFILISFLQVTFIPIPSTVTVVAGSFLFGPWLSFVYSYIGIVLGSLFAFLLGRIIGKPFVNWVVGDKKEVDKWLKRFQGKENVLLFFMLLLPLFPDDLLCSIAGILPISWLTFIIMILITRITGIAGNILFLSGEYIPYDTPWGLTIIIIGCILALIAFIICWKKADIIQDKFSKFIDKKMLKKRYKLLTRGLKK